MANNPIESCLVALTEILARNNQPENVRTRIEKETRFLPSFEGKPGTLPAFIDCVTRALQDYQGAEAGQAYQIIFNSKIQGSAKNLLSVNPPATWDDCKLRLRKHYKSSKDQMTITRNIGSLRVSSIKDLDEKVRDMVEDITEYAAFDDNGEVMIDIFSGMLVQKIKELVSGSLAYAVMNVNNLTAIRDVICQFIGQDQYNLNVNLMNRNSHNNRYNENRNNNHNKYSNNNNNYQNRSNDIQRRQNNNNYNQNRFNDVSNRYSNNNCSNGQNGYYNNNFNNFNNNNNTGHQRQNYYQQQLRQNNNQQYNSRTQQTRQNNNERNGSGQNRQGTEPMEIDAISRVETNTIDDAFFIN